MTAARAASVAVAAAGMTPATAARSGATAGGAGDGADGGGGAALGGAVFVRDGGTLTIRDSSFTGRFGVTAGTAGIGDGGGAKDGEAHGNVMYLHGSASTSFDVTTGHTTTIGGGTNATAGGIAGDGALTKTGDGTLVLSGANTCSGGTQIDGGTVTVGDDSALGTGNVAMAAGTTLAFSGDHTIANDIGIAGDPTFDVPTGDTDTIGGVISDSDPGPNPGVVEKAGDGTLVLTAANAYSGGTLLNAGTLTVGNDSALGTGDVAMAAGTTLAFSGSHTIANDISITGDPIFFVAAGDTDTISGVISPTQRSRPRSPAWSRRPATARSIADGRQHLYRRNEDRRRHASRSATTSALARATSRWRRGRR